jgi:hypothetical protein
MIIVGIDPGTIASGVATVDASSYPPLPMALCADAQLDDLLTLVLGANWVVVETVTNRGHLIGQSTLETYRVACHIERRCMDRGIDVVLVRPATWRADITGMVNATPAKIGACIREIYTDAGMTTGGGARPTIGTMKKPGPLYGIRSHAWDALGVALWRARQVL